MSWDGYEPDHDPEPGFWWAGWAILVLLLLISLWWGK